MAAYNGANTVLSGPGQDLEQAVAKLSDDGVRCDWLDTSHAFHSALLDPVLDEFESYANRFEFRAPQKTLVCNRTGAALGRSAKLDGAYWRRHARQPVEFAKSVRTLADLRCTMLLEIGPQPVLTAAAMRAWPDPATAPRAIASLRKNIADHRQITEALANAYIAGHRPDFGALGKGRRARSTCPPIRSSIASTGSVRSGSPTAGRARARPRCRAYRSRPASRGRPDRGTRCAARRVVAATRRPSMC